MRNVRSQRGEGATESEDMPEFTHFTEFAIPNDQALTRMDIDTSQVSHSSQAQAENLHTDEVEVF